MNQAEAIEAPPAAKAIHRIVIVEDHTLMREGLSRLVASQPDLTVCAEAADAAHGL